MKQKVKLLIILAVEFVVIASILLLIFFAGKKSYTVTFDLNGGTLLSGNTVQRVTQGQSADPPEVTKDGASFRAWSGSYRQVTHDITIKAVWEYTTTPGIVYSEPAEGSDSNFCEIIGCYSGIRGAVYIDGFHNNRTVIGIRDGVFEGREITSMYLLDGLLDIGARAFKDCVKMQSIELPSTVVSIRSSALENCVELTSLILPESLLYIGSNAFLNCEKITELILPENVLSIGENAFLGCEGIEEIIIPESVLTIGANAFDENTVIKVRIKESEKPSGWDSNCFGNATVIWEYVDEVEVDEDGKPIDKDDKDKKD